VALGQFDFIQNSANQGGGASVNTLNAPSGVAVDSARGLVVLDTGNCRALQFQPPFSTGMAAALVIGEPSFVATDCLRGATATPSSLFTPTGAAFDSSGNLWIADFGDSRILEFVPPFSNGMAASLVMGQTSLTGSAGCNQGLGTATASTLCSPHQITFDQAGNLWVADYGNNRVLEFVSPFSNGMAAMLELGQPAGNPFTTITPNGNGVSAQSLNAPIQPRFDSRGNLWVSDSGNNRVLEFVPPFSNGMPARLELGQPAGPNGFNTNTPGTTRSTFHTPAGIAFGTRGELLISDSNNNRVLMFVGSFREGQSASTVLGQANFTSGAVNQGGAPDANTLAGPIGVVDIR